MDKINNIVRIVIIITLLVVSSNLNGLVDITKAQPNTLKMDVGLAEMIDMYASDYYQNFWDISLSQYKAWISLITLREAGNLRYHAHSSSLGIDKFYHKEKGGDFPFSCGIGAFQLDRYGSQSGSEGSANENWGVMPTIKKIDQEESLLSVFRWHRDRFGDSVGGQGISLDDFSINSAWVAVRPQNEPDFAPTWEAITGLTWDECKDKYVDFEFNYNNPEFTLSDPFSNTVEYVGKAYWDLEGWKNYFNTWLISAKTYQDGGIHSFTYYYTFREDIGCEVWALNNIGEVDEFRYIFIRDYNIGQFPRNVEENYAGEDKLDKPALHLPTNVDVVLVIDRSGSMGWPVSKINNAKVAAKLFVDLMQVSDKIGIVSYASSVRVDHRLSKIESIDTKSTVKAKIDLIYASGMTAMGDALRVAYNQLVNYGNPSHVWAIVLMSNGWHNWGWEHPYDVIPDLQSENIKVYTIGLGAGANSDLLGYIASNTGGFYRFAPTSFDLLEIYHDLAGRITLRQIITSIIDFITQGATKIFETFIDSSITEVTYTVGWNGSDLDLTLIHPDGTIIDPTIAETDPNIEYIEEERYDIYRVSNPTAGTWQMIITGVDVPPEGETFFAQVSAFTTVTLNLATNKDSYTYPEPVKINVSLKDMGDPLTSADVEVIVTRPDSSQINLTLFDDGSEIHGDISPNDGNYTNYFTQFSEDGSYTIKAVAFGTTLTGESFSREAQKTILVSGVPLDITPPTTTLFIGSPQYTNISGNVYVCSYTPFVLSAIDNNGAGSGVDKTYYRIWYNASWSSWVEYTNNFTLSGEGEHYLEYYSIDNAGNEEEIHNQTFYVDDTPPEITLSDESIVIWPPNHKYHTVEISDFVISVTDICDVNVTIDDIVITSVSSDEPENAQGGGDGNTIDDIVIMDAQTVKLRVERQGGGNGRVYTINFEVSDPLGNTATCFYKVSVPHHKNSTAIDDGPEAGYTVYYP